MEPPPPEAARGRARAAGDPGHFALVMATGILAVAAHLLQWRGLGWLLLILAGTAFVVLWILFLRRLVFDWRGAAADLADQRHGPGYFAVVAGSCVLGSALVVVASDHLLARALWWLAILLWLPVAYGFYGGVITRREKPPAGSELHGGWLTAAVATEGISVLGTLLAAGEERGGDILFLALLMHLLGGAIYAATAAAVGWRLLFLPLTPGEFRAPYWICSGGAAISSLAGALMVVHAPEALFLGPLLPVLKGSMLLFWMVATAWLPLLALLTGWRLVAARSSFVYDANWWDAVFPLGMYTVCTFELSQAESSFPFLVFLAHRFMVVALVAWVIAASAMARARRR